MARSNKFVIQVFPAKNHQRITWKGHGQHGTLLLAKTQGELNNVPITGGLTETLYWDAILAQVVVALPL